MRIESYRYGEMRRIHLTFSRLKISINYWIKAPAGAKTKPIMWYTRYDVLPYLLMFRLLGIKISIMYGIKFDTGKGGAVSLLDKAQELVHDKDKR